MLVFWVGVVRSYVYCALVYSWLKSTWQNYRSPASSPPPLSPPQPLPLLAVAGRRQMNGYKSQNRSLQELLEARLFRRCPRYFTLRRRVRERSVQERHDCHTRSFTFTSTRKQKLWEWDHHLLRTKTPTFSKNLHWTSLMGSNGNSVKDVEKQITRVLFCGPAFPSSHQYTIEYLQNHSHIKVDVIPLEDVPKDIANYHVCIVKNMRLDSEIISRAVQMQLIMQYGMGLEGVDIDAATKHGIKVARIPSDVTGNSASCAEMAIYLMLGLLRKQNELQVSIQQKKVGEPTTETLYGKTIFILGFGNIGIDLAKRLQPFGVKVIAIKRSWASYACRNDVDDVVDVKGSPEDIYDFAGKADIVVCCLTLNRETAGIINNKFISSMKKGGLLVNVARGGLVDYEAVINHLESGHLGGLGTDVAWTEPFNPDDQIFKFKNVIMTPHVAGVTEYSYRSMAKAVGDAALQLHAGLPLTGIELVN